jgi:hypothetical protein
MPVASDATETAFCTAQFCTGGIYKSIVSMINSRMGLNKTIPIAQKTFFIL